MGKLKDNRLNIIGVIPARGGSKGVPRKNIRHLAGKPLIAYTIEAARESGVIDRVIVSTENAEIAGVAREYGAEVIERPTDLAQDETPTEPVMLHVIDHLAKSERYQPDVIVLLQATSPLRNGTCIRQAFDSYLDEGVDSLLSVCRSHAFLWKDTESGAVPVNYDYKNRPRRQDAEPEYRENGAIYLTSREILVNGQNRLGGRIGIHVMEDMDSLEIDTPYDFWLCEQVLHGREGEHGLK